MAHRGANMSFQFVAATAILGAALAGVPLAGARAAELELIAGGGMTGPIRELVAQFESATGHKLIVRFGTTPELIKMANDTPFDVAVVPREVFNDAGAVKQFVPGPTTDIARVGLGVAVRSGAAKPDIATPDALKQALLKAQSISTVPASAAGAQVLRLFDRLGVADEVKSKIRAATAPAQIVEAVAKGDAELGIFLANVLIAPGIDFVGPVPAALQQEIVFTASVAANAKQADAAKALIAFLQTSAAKALIKAKGMTPS
jgi:molybdate transport system substrate-binding protein